MIRSLTVHNIRSYELAEYTFNPSVTLVIGRNGSGKTTLLEALYVLLRGTSFRGRDRDMIAHNQTQTEFKSVLMNGDERRAKLTLEPTDKVTKVFTIEQKNSARVPINKRMPVVLFEPDELRLLSSSPQRRRQFIDDLLSRLYPSYATILNRYTRTLMQRNELLKQYGTMPIDAWENHLFVWDVKFAELAEQITLQRHAFLELSSERLPAIYSSIADTPHIIDVRYSTTVDRIKYKQVVLQKLSAFRTSDAMRGFTSVGPHRDDITIYLDGYPANETASRGEMRTIMLAYKLLEVELQEELSGTKPLILMDDVFSELDTTREQHLMRTLQGYQTIITATDLRDELKIDATVIKLSPT